MILARKDTSEKEEKMSEVDVKALEKDLRDLVAEIVEVEPSEVTPEADFVEDLGMDSMQALEIMAAIEKKYSVQVPEEHLGKIMNLTSLIDIAKGIIGGA